MKLNFRKIASVLASAVMIGSTVGTAIAANYPAPFVVGGKADAAIVVTSGTHLGASSDLFAALDLQQALQAQVTSTSGSTAGSVTGEAASLFTGSSKINYNDTLNSVKSVVTKSEMPVTLADGSFSGNVDATYTQTVVLGSNPQFTYNKMPTSSDDPTFGLQLSTTTSNYIYNATVTFNQAVAFNNSDSKNQDITLFGQKFTVGSATDGTNLVLLKESTKLNFDSSGQTSSDVTIGGKAYVIELVSASTTTAIVKVTDKAAGTSDSKEVSEGYSKKINGVTIAVNTADSNNLKFTASVVAGSEKYTFTSGAAVTKGDDNTVIDGTQATLTGGPSALTKLVVSIAASSSDSDAIKAGGSFVDPVFGNFKIDFSGINIPEESTAREDIKVAPSGDDKMSLTMTDYNGETKTIQYLYNRSAGKMLEWDTDGHQIAVSEAALLNRSDYAVVGNEEEGHLIKVQQITNQTTGYSNDKVTFQDVFSGDTYTATLTGEGTGTVTIGGKVYDVYYYGAQTLADEAKQVKLMYPDSSSTSDMILYPTITTSKGAKVFFYKNLTINLGGWDNLTLSGNGGDSLLGGNIKVPSFDNGYQSITVALGNDTSTTNVTAFKINSVTLAEPGNTVQVAISNTGLNYSFSYVAPNRTTVSIVDPETGAALTDPTVFVFSEKDDASNYDGWAITPEGAGTSTNGVGVNDVIRTWSKVGQSTITLASDSKKEKMTDLWGTVATLDKSDSDQAIATLSYPDEQIYAQLYLAATGASITPDTVVGGGGTIQVVKDSEAATKAADKNLIIVGGSCINTVAAKVLGSSVPLCGADFTTKTKVDAGKYIIKSFASPYSSAKVAVLVAGYEAAQTVDAVAKLKEGAATDVGSEKLGPTTV